MLKLSPLTKLPDVLLVEQQHIFHDARGVFLETFRLNEMSGWLGVDIKFVQGCTSMSNPYVLRGLHYQVKNPQGKLIRVLSGSIYDVMVDLRRKSPTFGKWDAQHLDATHHRALYIPPGFAHGFVAFDRGATVYYETTTYHDASSDRSLLWSDPTVGIDWPIGPNAPLTISAKDRAAKRLLDFDDTDYPQ